jgi:hypothetical protein
MAVRFSFILQSTYAMDDEINIPFFSFFEWLSKFEFNPCDDVM